MGVCDRFVCCFLNVQSLISFLNLLSFPLRLLFIPTKAHQRAHLTVSQDIPVIYVRIL